MLSMLLCQDAIRLPDSFSEFFSHQSFLKVPSVGVDQVNHLGNMTGFFINFDEIDMMFTDAPAIASWMHAVRYGLMGDPQTDEYFSYLLEDGSFSSSSSSSSVV